jgi:hypothetical protein
MLLSRDRLGLLFRKIAEWVTPTTELILIAAGALGIGRAYLNFDPQIIPAGREFLSAIQVHHLWTRAQACGWCALWDGSVMVSNMPDIVGAKHSPFSAVIGDVFADKCFAPTKSLCPPCC